MPPTKPQELGNMVCGTDTARRQGKLLIVIKPKVRRFYTTDISYINHSQHKIHEIFGF